jgi:predicted nucleic acid-binding protein
VAWDTEIDSGWAGVSVKDSLGLSYTQAVAVCFLDWTWKVLDPDVSSATVSSSGSKPDTVTVTYNYNKQGFDVYLFEVFFQTQKQQYPLSENEKRAIVLSLDAFILYLKRIKVNIRNVPLILGGISWFSVNYGVEAPDALHLFLASSLNCKYFLTVDEALTKVAVKEIEVMFPSIFGAYRVTQG